MASKQKHKQRSQRSYRKNLMGYQEHIRNGFFYQKKKAQTGIFV